MESSVVIVALIAVAVAACVLLVVAGLYGAHKLTRPARWTVQDSAARWGLPEPECVAFVSADGLQLSGWWFEPAPTAPATVLVCHGHGGNKVSNLWVAAALYPGFNVLLLDVRGHGESEGDLTSVGYLERLDIIGAATWVQERLGANHKLGVLGISMGAAAAILAAAECQALEAVVADSPFARLRTPIRLAIRARGYPRHLTPALAWSVHKAAAWLLGPTRRTWLDPADVVARIAPRSLFLIHGEADATIPVSESETLYRLAGEPKELWVLPETGHAQAVAAEPERYAQQVSQFFEHYLLRTRTPVGAGA